MRVSSNGRRDSRRVVDRFGPSVMFGGNPGMRPGYPGRSPPYIQCTQLIGSSRLKRPCFELANSNGMPVESDQQDSSGHLRVSSARSRNPTVPDSAPRKLHIPLQDRKSLQNEYNTKSSSIRTIVSVGIGSSIQFGNVGVKIQLSTGWLWGRFAPRFWRL